MYGNISGTVIICNEEDPNNKEIQNYKKYIKCSVDNKTLGYYTNNQNDLVYCISNGCTTTEPSAFKEITKTLPKYYINGNRVNDPENPLIICRYIENEEDYENKGCRYGKPLREEGLNDFTSYPVTFYNLFVNSGQSMSLISCSVVIKNESDHQSMSYSCNLIEAKDLSYYITSENDSSFVPLIKASLIECSILTNSCIEYEKENLRYSYYINTLNEKNIIKCDKGGCITVIGYNYYVDGCNENSNDDKTNCYQNSSQSTSGLINCGNQNCIKSKGSPRSIYVKGNGIGLIRCSNEKCEAISDSDITSINGDIIEKTFKNGGDDKNTNPIIVWNGIKWESQRAISNALYLNGNSGTEGSYSFIYCISDFSCSEITGDNTKKYIDVLSSKIFIYNENDDKFESGDNMNEILQKSIKGFIIYPETMEILKDNNKLGKLVICDGESEIDPICSTNGKYWYYLNGDNSENIIKNKGDEPKFISSPAQGYYINANNNIIACDGNKCYKYIKYEECSSNTVGSINYQLELCGKCDKNSENKIKISVESDDKYMVTISKDMFPGSLEGAYLLNISNKMIHPIFNEDDVKM